MIQQLHYQLQFNIFFYLGRDIGYALDTTLPCFALTQFISRLTDMVNLKCVFLKRKNLPTAIFSSLVRDCQILDTLNNF